MQAIGGGRQSLRWHTEVLGGAAGQVAGDQAVAGSAAVAAAAAGSGGELVELGLLLGSKGGRHEEALVLSCHHGSLHWV